MKNSLIVIAMLFSLHCLAQQNPSEVIQYNGIYHAKTFLKENPTLITYSYFKFYADGSVYEYTSKSNNADSVATFFSRTGTYSHSGTYQVVDGKLEIALSSEKHAGALRPLQLPKMYEGTLSDAETLCIFRIEDLSSLCLDFTQTN